jgi:hypothetical protein
MGIIFASFRGVGKCLLKMIVISKIAEGGKDFRT